MMAYAQVYQCNQLILLYPHHSGLGREEGILETFRIAGRDDTHLHVASVSLYNLTNIESRLMKLISGELSVLSDDLTQVA